MPASWPQSRSESDGSRILRLATAVSSAALAALVCSIPATTRVSAPLAHLHSPARVWIALAAGALLPMLVAILVLRGARKGLRTFGGSAWELPAYGAALWFATLLVELSLLGRLLRATTHNHALAGVAFALGALATAVASALVCIRVVALLNAASPESRLLFESVVALGALGALGWGLVGFSRAVLLDEASAAAAATVVDTLAFGLAAVLAAGPSLVRWRALALAGAPIALVVALLGGSMSRDGALSRAIEQRAPLFALLTHWVRGG